MYDLVPAQSGSGLATGPDGTSALPQLSVITGGVGRIACARQLTVELPLAGNVTTGGAIV